MVAKTNMHIFTSICKYLRARLNTKIAYTNSKIRILSYIPS